MTVARELRMRGRIYVRIDAAEVAQGDIIEYEDRGTRYGRVEAVRLGRKHQWARVAAVVYAGHTVRAAKRVNLRAVLSAWRRRTKAEQRPNMPTTLGWHWDAPPGEMEIAVVHPSTDWLWIGTAADFIIKFQLGAAAERSLIEDLARSGQAKWRTKQNDYRMVIPRPDRSGVSGGRSMIIVDVNEGQMGNVTLTPRSARVRGQMERHNEEWTGHASDSVFLQEGMGAGEFLESLPPAKARDVREGWGAAIKMDPWEFGHMVGYDFHEVLQV